MTKQESANATSSGDKRNVKVNSKKKGTFELTKSIGAWFDSQSTFSAQAFRADMVDFIAGHGLKNE